MFGRNQVSDRDLLKAINQRLARTGTASSSKVNVTVQQGNVTVTGTLQHAIQRSPIVKAITRVTGVRRVVDQMQHIAKSPQRPAERQNVRIAESTIVVESASEKAAIISESVDAPVDAVEIDEPSTDEPRPE